MRLNDKVQREIDKALVGSAKELSQRNESLLKSDDLKSELDSIKETSPRHLQLVQEVQDQARRQKTTVEQYVRTLPTMIKKEYTSAVKIIEPLIDAEGQLKNGIDIEFVAAACDNSLKVYIPVLWDEQAKPKLPELLYATILSSIYKAKSPNDTVSIPEQHRSIIKVTVSSTDSRELSERIAQELREEDMDLFHRARIGISEYVLDTDILQISSSDAIPHSDSEETKISRKELVSMWQKAEIRMGYAATSQFNHLRYLGVYIAEGRITENEDGSFSEQACKDLIQCIMAKKTVNHIHNQGSRRVPYDIVSELLNIPKNEAIEQFHTSRSKDSRESVSTTKLRHFFAGHTIFNGEWVPFENQLERKTAQNVKPITRPRNEYITRKEAIEYLNLDNSSFIRLTRSGKLPLYHADTKIPYLCLLSDVKRLQEEKYK